MNKKFLVILVVAAVLAAAGSWLVNQPRMVLAKDQKAKFQLQKNAVQVADNVYYLGKAHDRQSGDQVEGYAIVHRKDGTARPNGAKAGATACYGFLAKDAKWKWLEPWIVNPANTKGLDPNFIFNNLTGDIIKWETAATYNILDDGAMTDAVLTADTLAPDDKNEVYFADIRKSDGSDSNAIAVTIVWGVFGGPTFNRRLVEWDQIYDDATFDWSMSGEAGKMDF